MTRPQISVVMIFLNGERFISEAIDSIRAQTFENWELLLVDDGSTDTSSSLAREAAAEDPRRIQYLQHPDGANHGMSASRNLGIRESSAPLLAFLDADDVYLPERLAHHTELFDAHPEVGVVYGPRTLWFGWTGDPEDLARDRVYPTYEPSWTAIEPPRLFRDYLLGRAPTPATCSATIRRDVVADVGAFENSFTGMFEDQVLFLKLALHARTLVTDRALDLYRQHPGSTCAIALTTGKWSHTDFRNESQVALDSWLDEYLRQDVPHARAARRAHRQLRARTTCSTIPWLGPIHRRILRRSTKLRRRRMVDRRPLPHTMAR